VTPGQPRPFGLGAMTMAPGEDAEAAQRRWRTGGAWLDRGRECAALGMPATAENIRRLTYARVGQGLSGW